MRLGIEGARGRIGGHGLSASRTALVTGGSRGIGRELAAAAEAV